MQVAVAQPAARKSKRRSSKLRGFIYALVFLFAMAGTAFGTREFYRFWYQSLALSFRSPLPKAAAENGKLVVNSPTGYVLGRVGTYQDELSAYLYFEYLRSLRSVEHSRVLLTSEELTSGPVYRIYIQTQNDLLPSIPYLASLQAERFIPGFEIEYPSRDQLRYYSEQTRLFVTAYNRQVQLRLEQLPSSKLAANVAQFILFKSKTDRRVREQISPVLSNVSNEQARELAADIIAVGHFYSLPLELFLGIGAMENNFLDANGDLEHTVWKRRSAPGDLVIRRKGRRVLVWNYSIGVWQITRETLRYAHKLYLKDTRDYSQLPERLRPSPDLDFNNLNSHVLTTYAGLLLRDLLDRFDGDVQKAVGAYNGGPSNPNPEYATGVEQVAVYARRVLTQAAVINGQAIAQTKLIVSEHR